MLGKKRANIDRIKSESGAESLELLKPEEAQRRGEQCPAGKRALLARGSKEAVQRAAALVAESLGVPEASLVAAPAGAPGGRQAGRATSGFVSGRQVIPKSDVNTLYHYSF